MKRPDPYEVAKGNRNLAAKAASWQEFECVGCGDVLSVPEVPESRLCEECSRERQNLFWNEPKETG